MINDVLLKGLTSDLLRNVIEWNNYAINGYKFVIQNKNEGMYNKYSCLLF